MFDDIIRNKANSHEAPVPPDAWSNIIKQRRKKRFGFLWWTIAALLIATLSVTGYLMHKNNNAAIVTAESKQTAADKIDAGKSAATSGNTVSSSAISQTTTTDSPTVDNKNNDVITTTATGNKNIRKTFTNKHAAVKITTPSADGIYLVETKENNLKKNSWKLSTKNNSSKKAGGKTRYHTDNAETDEIITITGNEKLSNAVISNDAITNEATNYSTQADLQKNIIILTDSTGHAAKEQKKIATIEKNKESTTHNNQHKKQHWYIDGGIAPTLLMQQYDEHVVFNRTLFLNNSRSVYTAKLASTSIDPSMAFYIGIRRTLSKKIMIGLGLQYLLLKENISISGSETTTQYNVVQRLVNGAAGPQLLNDTVATVTEGTRKITAVNSYHLYSIPLFMQYNLVQKRAWSFSAVGGMYINIGSTYQNEINRNAAAILSSTVTTGKTAVGYDLFAGLKFGKTIGNKVEIFVLPSMRWALQPYRIKNSLLNKSIEQAGFSVGVSYKLN